MPIPWWPWVRKPKPAGTLHDLQPELDTVQHQLNQLLAALRDFDRRLQIVAESARRESPGNDPKSNTPA